MATTQVYTCDICKQSKDKNSLANIEVSATGIRMKYADRYNPMKIDICPECLKKKGFVVELKVDEAEDIQTENRNKMTLEDKLYDILHDMDVAFCE